jgi:hypothetical protein
VSLLLGLVVTEGNWAGVVIDGEGMCMREQGMRRGQLLLSWAWGGQGGLAVVLGVREQHCGVVVVGS